MAKHSHEEHEFGVPSVNLDLTYEPQGYYDNAEFPAGSIYILQRQRLEEEEKTTNARAIDEEAAEQRSLRTAWMRDFSFGPVMRPQQNTLRGYKFLLRENDGANGLQFSPKTYPVFDNVIVHECGVDKTGKSICPAFNPNHPHYEDFAPLRRNIAILRNYLLVTLFPEGDFLAHDNSPAGREDLQNHRQIQLMAMVLGKGLAGETSKNILPVRFIRSLWRLITGQDLSEPNLSPLMNAANIPDKGIAVMYNYLFERHSKPTFWESLPFVQSPRDWKLLPREETPFSNTNLHMFSRSSMLEGVADKFDEITTQLSSVNTLSEADKCISVEHARTILEKLRILMGNSSKGTELHELTDSSQEKSFMLLRAAMAFEKHK